MGMSTSLCQKKVRHDGLLVTCPMETADFRSLAIGLWPPKLAVGRQTAFQYPSHNETGQMGLVGDGPSQE